MDCDSAVSVLTVVMILTKLLEMQPMARLAHVVAHNGKAGIFDRKEVTANPLFLYL